MGGFAEIRFKGTRRDYFSFRDLVVLPGAHVVVEADRGPVDLVRSPWPGRRSSDRGSKVIPTFRDEQY